MIKLYDYIKQNKFLNEEQLAYVKKYELEREGSTTVSSLYDTKVLAPHIIVKLYCKTANFIEASEEALNKLSISKMKEKGLQIFIDEGILLVEIGNNVGAVVWNEISSGLLDFLRKECTVRTILVADRAKIDAVIIEKIKPLLTSEVSKEYATNTLDVSQVIDFDVKTDVVVQKIIRSIITTAVDMRASDIKIIPAFDGAKVYFRIDGKRKHYIDIENSVVFPIFRVLAEMTGQQSINDSKVVEGKATIRYKQRLYDFRLNIIPTKTGQSINIRILGDNLLDFSELGINSHVQDIFNTVQKLSKGLILFVGPTGSGKSTSMIALLRQLLKMNVDINTAEDPVEQIIDGITQVDTSITGISYADAIKSFMRHDPDVIMIGEIRDYEVAEEVIKASDTGHLVISTLHTNDAISTINRLINLGVSTTTLAESLTLVISQRLIRKLCSSCKVEYSVAADSIENTKYGIEIGTKLYKSSGCTRCHNTGYSGRTCICECVMIGPEMRKAIEERMTTDAMRAIIKVIGVKTLIDDGTNKIIEGLTTVEELESYRISEEIRRGNIES